jgi:N-acetylmuramoyl-L-alanine amidase
MLKLVATSVFVLFSNPVWSAGELIYIDPGHTLDHPGVIGSCETPEVWVNDQLSLKLANDLRLSGYRVAFSREPNTNRSVIRRQAGRESPQSLRRRGERANSLRAALFISIHHDAIAENYLVVDRKACPGSRIRDPLVISPDFMKNHTVGFNVFIHNAPGTKFRDSLRLASLVGKGFIDAQQIPSTFHVPQVEPDCTSCRWQDPALGVMSRNLGVIRTPNMPAILLEVNNLRLADQERLANEAHYQSMIAATIKRAVDQYFNREN